MTTYVGRLCFRHRWLVLFVWIAAMTGGALAAGTVFERLGDTNQMAGTESGDAREVLNAASDRDGQVVALWEGIDPAAVSTVDALARAASDLAQIPGVKQVEQPVTADDGKGVALALDFAHACE